MASVAVSLFPAPADEFDYGTIEQYDRLFATAPVPISRDDAHGSVTYTHDVAGRRTSLTLANGFLVEYGYDNASRLTSITI